MIGGGVGIPLGMTEPSANAVAGKPAAPPAKLKPSWQKPAPTQGSPGAKRKWKLWPSPTVPMSMGGGIGRKKSPRSPVNERKNSATPVKVEPWKMGSGGTAAGK